MLFKNIGFDPEKIMKDFTALKDGVTETLKNINTRLEGIEKAQKQNHELQMAKMEELCQTIRTALKMSSQIQLVPQPQPPAPNQPQPPQAEPNTQPPLQP